ncbi:MAG: oxidoreductase [Alphaproteobacteria bacterium]|nr:oxidoreductase [Alphaproteobacteria bacterium]
MPEVPVWVGALAPSLFVLAALLGFLQPGKRPATAGLIAGLGALSIAPAILAGVALAQSGPTTLALASGFSLRFDLVSVTLLILIAAVGAIVLRFSRTYLDGTERQGAFLGWMSLTLAAVISLVTAGNLVQLAIAWIATSLFLHQLLLFFSERAGAQRAAQKKFVVARIGDAALLGAAWLLHTAYQTTDIATILDAARAGNAPAPALWATGLIALAAVFKSAQFPTHGWLTEVMEAPTPVSAMLHAGLINAGGFLLIRFADVLLLSPPTLAVLVFIGGFTALFGGLVMLSQPAVKTSLAWSTVAQMGFMIFQCGLALFPLALLHIVAHSLYKAHAFLSSGTAVEQVAAIRRPGPVATPGWGAVVRAFVMALAIYAAMSIGYSAIFGADAKSPQALALGAILVLGVAYLFAQGFADTAPKALTAITAGYAAAATIAYFALQAGAQALYAGVLPAAPAPGPLEWALLALAIVSFGLVAIAQATFPNWAYHPAAAGLRVHLANGLYVNALTDRWLGLWSKPRRA